MKPRPAIPPLRCPWCAHKTRVIDCGGALCFVECTNLRCDVHGPIRKTARGAVRAWNRIVLAAHCVFDTLP